MHNKSYSRQFSLLCPTRDVGDRAVQGQARDEDGGVATNDRTVPITVTFASLRKLTTAYSAKPGAAKALTMFLTSAERAHGRKQPRVKTGVLKAYAAAVHAQPGNAFSESGRQHSSASLLTSERKRSHHHANRMMTAPA
jgi:hypothetical protein